jgi:hypothetical protein
MIKEAVKRSLVLGDDNPELTDEQLASFCGVHESNRCSHRVLKRGQLTCDFSLE